MTSPQVGGVGRILHRPAEFPAACQSRARMPLG